jgi:YYY domain-containing protein
MSMHPVFTWWMVVEILGLAALPLTYWLFKNLPDRGYAFAKPLGILLTSYVLWIGGSFGFLRNSWGGIVFSILVVAVGSWWFYSRENRETGMASFLRENRRMVIANEVLFALAFALFALYRAYNPEIMGTEKPMEFAFLNAILRSDTFPPHDPWLSGFGISYYYFGYLMMAMLTKLSGVPSPGAFNLGITLLFALTVTGAYALVYNLVKGAEEQRSRGAEEQGKLGDSLTRYLLPLLGPIFVAILGNLETIFEVLYSKGLGSAGFWNWLDIKELVSNGRVTGRWFDLGSGWWWWRASRVIHDKDLLGNSMEVIDEFPFFSFMLGDMHPHVLALPFVLLALALALNVLRQRSRGAEEQEANLQPPSSIFHPPSSIFQFPFSNFQHPLLYALCLGALAFLNTWDFPIYLFVVAMAYGLHRYGHYGKLNWALVRDVAYTTVGLGLLGGLLYLPFYIGFQSQAGGILPNLFNPTRLHQYLIFFGPFLFAVISFLGLVTKQVREEGEGKNLISSGLNVLFWAMFLPPLAAFGAIAGILFTARGQTFLRSVLESPVVRQQIGEADLPSLARRFIAIRLGNPWTWLFLALLIAWVIALLWGRLRAEKAPTMGEGLPMMGEGLPMMGEGLPMMGEGLQTEPSQFKSEIENRKSEMLSSRSGDLWRSKGVAESSTLFVLLMIATGLALTLSVEFIYLRDTFGTRMNTVFKFYYQAWVLLALASAYGVYYIVERARGLGRLLFLVGFAVLFALAMIYPVVAGLDKAGGFAHQPTLDGLAWVRQHSPDEYAAVQWLNKHVRGTPVILEATGGSFTEYGRVSSRTGLPTLLGWGGHELQWRGNYEEPGRREPDINTIYGSLDTQHVLTLLEKYDITYVYVGSLERGKYSPAALAKFSRFMDVVFQQGNVTIYKRRP